MLNWPPQVALWLCGLHLCLACAAYDANGQESKTGSDALAPAKAQDTRAPKPGSPVPSSSDAVSPVPASPSDLATVAEFDYSSLAHPRVAEQLELSDEQRAAVVELINERANQLAGAPAEKRTEIDAAANRKLAALLNDGQRAKLSSMSQQRRLRFNFRYQKWDDVLDWFARQAGLALVMDQPPPGEFTYSDNRSYSPTEAIDLLNSVLLTKGFTLIQRGRMLVLADLSGDLPLDLIPRVPVEEIADRGRFDMITVLFPLGKRPADTVEKEIQPLIGPHGTAVALPQTGQLLVRETAGNMRAIGILISSIPEPQPPKPKQVRKEKPKPPPVLGVYPVTVIEPATAVETLAILFPNAKFTTDQKADQVMAYATPSEQEAIKAAVDQMQTNQTPDQRPRLEVYPLDVPIAQELLEQMQGALPKVQATVDPASQRLLVFADPKDQETVKEMVRKLGAEVDEETRQVVVYQAKHFDPAALGTLIQELVPRADVSTDPRLRRVVVSASPASQTMVKALVEQLDQEAILEDKPTLQFYPLNKPVEASVVTTLNAIVPDAKVTLSKDGRELIAVARAVDQIVVKRMVEQWQQAAEGQTEPTLKFYPLEQSLEANDLATIKSIVPGAESTLSPEGDQLTVVAREADHAAVESLLQKLSDAATARKKPTLKIYSLDEKLATTDVATLQALVPKAQITLAADGRHLNVVAGPNDQLEIESLIKQLSAAISSEGRAQLAVYPLAKPINPTVLSTLQTMVPEAKVTLSADLKQLIVVARDDEQTTVKQMLDRIKMSADAVGRQRLEVYDVDGLSAAELQKLLQPLVVDSTITIDVPQDRLIVWGPADEHTAFSEVVSRLEQDPLSGTKPVLEFYPLDDDTVSDSVITALTTLAPTAQVTWDAGTSRLSVIATPKEQQIARETIEQITQHAQPVEKQVLRLYSLSPAQQTRFSAIQPDLLTQLPGLRVIQDPQTGELAIWARASQHEKLTEILDQLKISSESSEPPVMIAYAIDNGSTKAIFDMLKEVYPTMRLSVDEKTDRIVAFAPLSQHGRIKQMISQLDVEASPNNQEALRSYSTGEADPTPILPMVQQLVPDMQLTAEPKTRKIVAWGSVRDHTTLEKAIEQFRSGDPTERPVVRAYETQGRSATALYQMRSVLMQVTPEAVIAIDPRGGSIVVSADETDHQKIQAAIDQIIEIDRTATLKLETYSLERLEPSQVITSLRPIVPDAQLSVGSQPGQIVVWASEEDHERVKAALEKLELAAGADGERVLQLHRIRPAVAAQAGRFIGRSLPRLEILTGQGSERLLVWATPKDHAQLAKLIAQMDSEMGFDIEREMRTYELGDVSPTEARRLIEDSVGVVDYVTGSAADRLVIRTDVEKHEQILNLLDELKKAVTLPDQIVRVHRYEVEERDISTLYNALSPDDLKDLSIQLNVVTNSLIVRGSVERQDELAETLTQLVDQLPTPDKPVAEVYKLDRADPAAVSLMVRSLLPAVPIATDVLNRTIAATATVKDHAKIRKVIEQLDSAEGEELLTDTYVLKRANPTAVMMAIKPIVPRATISSDVYNKMLIVTAVAEDHEQIKAIVEDADGRGEGELTTIAYPVKYANSATISVALTSVVPDAIVSADTLNKMLIATASEKDHQRIQDVLDQADKRGGGELITTAYVLQVANPATISIALRPVVPNATISPDPTNKTLIVTASEEDQQRVKSIVEEADRRSEGELTTEVYALQWANPIALSYSLKPIAPNATVSPDVYNKTLIVTAAAKDHERVKVVIDQADRRGGGEQTTKAYSLKWANAITISTALTAVVPDAKISSDPTNKMLIVTGSKVDHDKIQAVLDEADKRGGGELVTRAYILQTANPTTIMLALRPIVPDATVSSDITNKMLVVTASEDDHQKILGVVDEADRRSDGDLVTQVYALQWANPLALSYSLKPIAPNATVSPDVYNKTLIVTATAKDHDRIKPVIEQADRRGGGEMITKSYALKWANPTAISAALTTVVPDAKISSDVYNKMLIVSASKEDHDRIQAVLEQADERGGGDLITKAYVLRLANPSTIALALRPVVPDATLSPDPTNKVLVATASEEDHLRIKTIVDEADRVGDGELTTETYSLKWANPLTISTAIRPIVPNATIGTDTVNKTLIVTAPESEQEKIKKIVERADRRGEGELLTKVYAFKLASPASIVTGLRTLIPNAIMTSDATTNTLIVTGNVEDHQQIEPLVKDLDVASPTSRVLKSYVVDNGKAEDVYQSLSQLFRLNREVSIGYESDTGLILVFAPSIEQDEVANVLQEIDSSIAARPKATLEVYSLEGLDGDAAINSLEAILADETPKVEFQVDSSNNQVLAIADPSQQEMIRKTLSQLVPEEREVEVFNLQRVDPYTAQSTIDTMYINLPLAAMPSVEPDPDTQQLIVRGTKKQLEEIRQLLQKMGEDPEQKRNASPNSMMRVIPLSGDVDATVREIQRIWPQLRGNQMEVVKPPQRSSKPNSSPPVSGEPDDATNDLKPHDSTPPTSSKNATPEKSAQAAIAKTMLVSAQLPTTQAPQSVNDVEQATGQADEQVALGQSKVDSSPNKPLPSGADPTLPPILVIAGEGSITVASRDNEALDQFEHLLQTIQRGRRVSITTGNFSMYLLQNADATELAEVLTDLFRQGSRSSSRSSYRSRRGSNNVQIVADKRMNALLVYGSLKDREVVEEMLQVLDSVDIPDSLSTERPQMIPVKNLPASTVLGVLKSVYQTQLTARRGLRQVTIPQGISPQMSSMLELLNATADAPILTLDTDETTNSIVMRAPRQLAEEIEEFIQELDQQAQGGGTRSISLVPLKGMSSEQVQEAVDLLRRGGRYRRSRRR